MPLPQNINLEWLDVVAHKKSVIYVKTTAWVMLPIWLRVLLVFGVCLMSFSTYLFFLFDSACFGSFTVNEPGWSELYSTTPISEVITDLKVESSNSEL
jgi:hypothetical protein